MGNGRFAGPRWSCYDYYFISVEEFNQKIQHNEFVEWELVYEGKYYGTLKSELERIWNNNQVPVLDIDVKGAIHVQEQYQDSTLSIFVEPPSVDELKRRLSSRGTESEESLQTRVNKASYEISFKHHFRKIILNDNLDHACKEAEKVVREFLESWNPTYSALSLPDSGECRSETPPYFLRFFYTFVPELWVLLRL